MKRKRKPDLSIRTIVSQLHPPGSRPPKTGFDEYMATADSFKDDHEDKDKEAFRNSLLLNMTKRPVDDSSRSNLMQKIFPNLPPELSLQIADDAWGKLRDNEDAKNMTQIDLVRYGLNNGPPNMIRSRYIDIDDFTKEDLEELRPNNSRLPLSQLKDKVKKLHSKKQKN